MADTARKRAASSAESSVTEGQRGKRLRLPATCEWILRESAYKAWKAGDKSASQILWIHGPPGCGKTFLAQTMVDDIQRTGSSTLFYFCDANSTPESVFRSLLVQMLQFHEIGDDLRAIIARSTAEASPGDQEPPLDLTYKLWDTISDILTEFPDVTFVIDGLDEIAEGYLQPGNFDLPSKLIQLTSIDGKANKLLLSSRTEPTIRRSMKNSLEILVTAASVNEDLERFIESEVMEYRELDEWRNAVCKTILEKSEGIFLWAALAVRSLAGRAPISASPESLGSVQASLDDLYSSILFKQATGLTEGQMLLRDQILRWVLFAIRPLHLEEMANAIAVESNAYIYDLESKATEVCGSLIKIEKGILKPIHHSLREYLMRDYPKRDEILSVRSEASNLVIAKSLLTYLSHPSFSQIYEPLNTSHFRSTYPLAEYAALYWVYHISNATKDPNMRALIADFFNSSSNWATWADKLLPHYLPLSTLPIPPRPFNTARFAYLFTLKEQLASYFEEEEKAKFTEKFEDSLRILYEGFAAQAQSECGPESLKAAQRLQDLAELYSWISKYRSQALAQLQAASFIISKKIGLEAEGLSITVHQALADEYKRAGKYNDAQKLLEVLTQNGTLSSRDPRRMFALDALGWVNMRLGNLNAAESHLTHAKDLASQIYGSQSPMTLRSKVTLAEVLGKMGRHEEAEALCAELKEQLRKHRDDGIPLPKDSISQLNTLASVFMQEGKFREAKSTYEIVVDDRRRTFGDGHGMTLWAEMQLGTAMEKAGDVDGARILFANLLPRQEKALGASHPDVKDVKERLR
ncbi:hypothetical protein CC78DRAFT_453664 [Lojkania enalia]|uniref:NACHT domain-containing protein n=1 Tax=Lojkania enalia TaxID=147567 RepID=A0A9P4TPV4_9PLEO|nr:hypothetical protein CC78DRAFT_453664 [Didymosphaeria enalia]